MSISIPLVDPTDPKEGAAAVPFHMPHTDHFWTSSPDYLSTLSMSLAGGAMFTKNRFFAWPAFLMSLMAYLNAAPLRATESSSSGSLQGLGFAVIGLFSVYIPSMILTLAGAAASNTSA